MLIFALSLAWAKPCDAEMLQRAESTYDPVLNQLLGHPVASCVGYETSAVDFAVLDLGTDLDEGGGARWAWVDRATGEGGTRSIPEPDGSGMWSVDARPPYPYGEPVVEVVTRVMSDGEGTYEVHSYWHLAPSGPASIHEERVTVTSGSGYPHTNEDLSVTASRSISGDGPDLRFHRRMINAEPDEDPVQTERDVALCFTPPSTWEPSEDECRIVETATASSTLDSSRKSRYDAELAVDDAVETAWVEGVAGPGIGERLRITLGRPAPLSAIAVLPGYLKTVRTWSDNNRVKSAVITLSDGTRIDASFTDDPTTQSVPMGGTRLINWVELEIREVYPGARYDDTCVSDVELSW